MITGINIARAINMNISKNTAALPYWNAVSPVQMLNGSASLRTDVQFGEMFPMILRQHGIDTILRFFLTGHTQEIEHGFSTVSDNELKLIRIQGLTTTHCDTCLAYNTTAENCFIVNMQSRVDLEYQFTANFTCSCGLPVYPEVQLEFPFIMVVEVEKLAEGQDFPLTYSIKNITFTLVAIIHHQRSDTAMHFVSYIRYADKVWLMCDDAVVKVCTNERFRNHPDAKIGVYMRTSAASATVLRRTPETSPAQSWMSQYSSQQSLPPEPTPPMQQSVERCDSQATFAPSHAMQCLAARTDHIFVPSSPTPARQVVPPTPARAPTAMSPMPVATPAPQALFTEHTQKKTSHSW